MNWSIGRSYPTIGAQSCLQKKFVQAMQNVSFLFSFFLYFVFMFLCCFVVVCIVYIVVVFCVLVYVHINKILYIVMGIQN